MAKRKKAKKAFGGKQAKPFVPFKKKPRKKK
jgi:hypothetical protein